MQLITLAITIPIALYIGYRVYLYTVSMHAFQKNPLSQNRSYLFSWHLFITKQILFVAALFFLTGALIRPQWGIRTISSEERGIDIVFTLDVSESMKAQDIQLSGEELDRLSLSKAMIQEYVQENPQNRYSLVIFAGDAFVSTPLTMDEQAFITLLDGVNSDDVSTQGTDLEEALRASIERFRSQDREDRGNAIILISDGGEDDSGNYQDFAGIAQQEGVAIYTVGVGGTKGVPIPDGVDFFGTPRYKTYQGETVLTARNEKPLREIASISGGRYFSAESVRSLGQITSRLDNLETSVLTEETGTQKEDQYQIFVFMACISFLLAVLLPINKEVLQSIYNQGMKMKKMIASVRIPHGEPVQEKNKS